MTNDSLNDKSPEKWKLLTVSRKGTVSLVKGLSEAKAKELAYELLYETRVNRDFEEQMKADPASCFMCSISSQDSDIMQTEAFE